MITATGDMKIMTAKHPHHCYITYFNSTQFNLLFTNGMNCDYKIVAIVE